MRDTRRPSWLTHLAGGLVSVLIEAITLATLVLFAWAIAVLVTAIG